MSLYIARTCFSRPPSTINLPPSPAGPTITHGATLFYRKTAAAEKSSRQREAVFHPEFRDDLKYWVKTDRKTAVRAWELVEAILRNPFVGIGKPEHLRFVLSGVWSRRLAQEHRIVYVVSDGRIDFI